MTPIAVSARCERCGADLVISSVIDVPGGNLLAVVRRCPTCDPQHQTATRPLKTSTLDGGRVGERRPGQFRR